MIQTKNLSLFAHILGFIIVLFGLFSYLAIIQPSANADHGGGHYAYSQAGYLTLCDGQSCGPNGEPRPDLPPDAYPQGGSYNGAFDAYTRIPDAPPPAPPAPPSYSSPPGGDTTPPEIYSSPPGGDTTPPGDYPAPPGEYTSPPGSYPAPPGGYPTPAYPTPAYPTPFSEDMCKCDGIESTKMRGGRETTFTAFGKVEGSDITIAIIKSFSFMMTEGDSTTGKKIAESGPIPALEIARGSSLVRYQADWKQLMPTGLKRGATYRIQAKIQCELKPRARAANGTGNANQSVLAAQTQNDGFFGNISQFFRWIFGKRPATQSPTAATPAPSASVKNIKLDTFGQPGELIEKTCSTVKFKMP